MKKNLQNLLFYIGIISVFSVLIYITLIFGTELEAGRVFGKQNVDISSSWEQFIETSLHNISHPLAILVLQIITIILAARVFGFICKKIGQPSVVGEIAAGIFLGPSFIGMYLPEFSQFLFPAKSLGNLQFLSQIGLILFMFVVGMELDLKVLKNKAHEAVVVSHASIIIPFTLGMGLAYFIYQGFSPQGVKFLPFALFIGIAMSITAFPVLARIVQERGLSKTKLGTVVITCAAADDITAWCLLAAVIAIVKAGSFISALYTILLAAGFVIIMLNVVRPFLKRVGDLRTGKDGMSKSIVAIFFVTLLVSAYATEVIGIHALFGAFMAGVIMPAQASFRKLFIEKVEDVSLVLLLPLFFVFTGLRTQIGLLNEGHLWQLCGMIILVAVVGKFLGSALAARFVGQSWRESLIIGALMNTRGLMELVVLNIGYDLGILTPEIFAMMVIMALVTTFMTSPALNLINRLLPEKIDLAEEKGQRRNQFKILISFGSPQRGKSLLRLANSLIKKSAGNSVVTALHLSSSNELNQFNRDEYEQESFEPVKQEAEKLGQPVLTMFKPSDDIDREITKTANLGNFDLLLVGIGRSIFEGTLLGRILGFTTKMINPERLYDTLTGKEKLFDNTVFDERTRQIIKTSKIPVGILIDKELEKTEQVFVPIFSAADGFLLTYAQMLIQNSLSKVTILDVTGIVGQTAALSEKIAAIEKVNANHITLYNENKIEKEFISSHDLMLISSESWKTAVETQSVWLSNTPSVLIIKS